MSLCETVLSVMKWVKHLLCKWLIECNFSYYFTAVLFLPSQSLSALFSSLCFQNFRPDVGQCPLISQSRCIPDYTAEEGEDAWQILSHRPCREWEGGRYIKCWPPNSSGGSRDQQKLAGPEGLWTLMAVACVLGCQAFPATFGATSVNFHICLWTGNTQGFQIAVLIYCKMCLYSSHFRSALGLLVVTSRTLHSEPVSSPRSSETPSSGKIHAHAW